MKRSSIWNSPIPPSSFSQRAAVRILSLVVTSLWCVVLAACSSPPPIPPQFDVIEHIPIHTVLVQGRKIAYLDIGQGDPVVLIHGFGGSMWQWEHQQTTLSKHMRVITLDLLGAGLSDKPDMAYSPDQMLDFFVGFMDALRLPRATLAGNSMGAGLAIGMALTHPDRVTTLILIDGLPDRVLDKLTSPSIRRALETRAPAWLVTLGNWLFGEWMTESILQEIVYDPTLLTPAVIERSKRNRKQPGLTAPTMTIRDNLPLWESGFARRLGEIRHPTLILWGEEDRVFPIAVGEALHRTITGSRLVRIPNAGHIPQWEQPAISNDAMVEFFRLR